MNKALQNLEIKVENGGTTPQGRLTSSEWNILVAAVKALDADSVDPSQLEAYLKPYAKTADVASTYATIASLSAVTSRLNDFLVGSDTDAIINKWSELETFLAGLTETDNLATILSGKANKATTLAGYGITDAYTKSHIDSNFVTIGTKQEITGEKDFVGGFKVNGGLVEYNATLKAWVLNGDLLVTGGMAAFSNISGFKPSTITDAVLIDNRTIKRNADGLLYAVAQETDGINEEQLADYLTTNGYLTGITGAMVTNALGYAPLSTSGGTITATGRRQLSLQSSTDAQAVLWLGTGLEQFSKGGFLQYDYSNGSIALVNFSAMANSYSGLAGLFIKRDNRITVGDANLAVEYDILHAGNIGQYALSTTGGTVNGVFRLLRSADNPPLIHSIVQYSNSPYGLLTRIYTDGNVSLQAQREANDKECFNLQLNPLGGNVVIGGTTASEKLHLYGNMLFDGERVLKSSLIGEVLYMGGSYLVIGGGTTTKGIPTYIDGKTVYVRAGNYVATFSDAGGLTWNGNLLTNGGITAQNSSDERLKRNLRKFNASKVLMSLGGVYEYEYIDSEVQKNHIYEGTHYGLIYQHVKGTQLDVMCHEREDGMGALNYIHPKFISLVAGATMENISEVEKMKRKIRTLEAKVKQLEQRA